jgi:hypothetical protein
MLRPRRTVALLGVTALVGALALAGCSADSPSSSSAPAGDFAAQPDAEKAGAPQAPGAANDAAGNTANGGTGQAPTEPGPIAEDRALIYTGTITIKVDSVSAKADQAIAAATAAGGIVAGDNRVIDDDRSQATLVLRVPADRFASTLDALGRLGDEESRQVQAQDVTDQLVDLDARVATQEASVNRVRDLLARAQSIGEIVTLESELTRRQADLDSLKQRRAKLSGLVALATITVVLHAPAAPGAPEEPDTGFLAGLRNGWDGFLASVTIVLTVAGWLLPWIIAIGVPVWFALWLTRRLRRPARPATPPSAPTATTPTATTPIPTTPSADA